MPNRLKVPFDKKTDSSKLVTVRFAPEPSGYLHIGHTKPLFLNDTIKHDFNGKFILRFDDTNPKKESNDFEKSICEDISMLNIDVDKITHTSDYFDEILEFAIKLIKDGNAYMDCTDAGEMKEQRANKIPSSYRNVSIESNIEIFNEFVTDSSSKWCVRAKISFDNVNACLRDPVIMRSCSDYHIKHGNKYKVYPTYDFCCPIVDHIEGVTHALRANEYVDHYDIYKWMCKRLNLNQPYVVHFAKIRFECTVMSKRYLKKLVELGLVTGWDDPRLPTVRGLMNRGLTSNTLKEYIIGMGLNNKISLPSWDKLWSLNKKSIDKIIPRFSSVNCHSYMEMHIDNITNEFVQYETEKHPTNKNLGTKISYKSNRILINKYDGSLFEIGDRVGLLRNIVVEIEDIDGLTIKCFVSEDQDFKTTNYKINWLANDVRAFKKYTAISYGDLIIKQNMDKNDNIEDIFNTDSASSEDIYIEVAVNDIAKNSFVQLERRGYYIFNGIDFVQIPEGKQKGMIN